MPIGTSPDVGEMGRVSRQEAGEGGDERDGERRGGEGWMEWGSERWRGRRRDREVDERREGKVGGKE